VTATMHGAGPESRYRSSVNVVSYLGAFAALLVVASGAVATSLERTISPTPGAPIPTVAATFRPWHLWGATVVALLILGEAVWIQELGSVREASRWGWVAFAAFVVEAGLGAVVRSLSPLTDILHALFSSAAFGAAYAVAILTSKRWQHGPSFIEDTWRPPLRTLAMILPAVVLLQVIIFSVLHVRNGALTLATTTGLSLEIRRSVIGCGLETRQQPNSVRSHGT